MLPWPRLMDCSICVAIPLKQCATFLKPFHGFTGRLWLENMYFTSQRFLLISGLLALRFLKLWTLVNLFVLVYVSATFDGQRYEVWCQWCPSMKYSTITMASESTMEKKKTLLNWPFVSLGTLKRHFCQLQIIVLLVRLLTSVQYPLAVSWQKPPNQARYSSTEMTNYCLSSYIHQPWKMINLQWNSILARDTKAEQ